MGRLLLLLRLEGPLQSWGTRARWDVRDTGLEPTKSGVIGLLGCAMGLSRGSRELERLDGALRFAVRVDHPGIIATDYHTVSGYHRTAAGGFRTAVATQTFKSLDKAMEHGESTIVSPRDYLHDACFLVALAGDETLLQQLAGEVPHQDWPGDLRRPAWPMYLGRKSCVPTRPIFLLLTDAYADLEDALRRQQWDPPQQGTPVPETLDAWVECRRDDPEWQEALPLSERQDSMRINPGRFYAFRHCRYVQIPTSSLTGGF